MPESKIGRIRALLAKAEATEFEAEAESLREKAFALMAKHGVEQTLLNDTGETEPEATREIIVIEGGYHSRRVLLLNSLVKAMRCEASLVVPKLKRGQKTKNSMVWVYGMPSDIERVKLMWDSLDTQLSSALAHSLDRKPTGVHGRTWSVNFISAFAAKVYSRVQAAEDDETQAANDRFALVLADNSAKVRALFDHDNNGVRNASYANTRSSDGWSAGSRAGERANLGSETGSVGGSDRIALGIRA